MKRKMTIGVPVLAGVLAISTGTGIAAARGDNTANIQAGFYAAGGGRLSARDKRLTIGSQRTSSPGAAAAGRTCQSMTGILLTLPAMTVDGTLNASTRTVVASSR